MATLGNLEQTIMNVLWDADGALAANEIKAQVPSAPAVTTVLTVLTRLEHKGFVTRDRSARPHLYEAVTTRADHMAELMHEVLGDAKDRSAVLARFVGGVSPSEAAQLRKLLDGR
jgi:predicted transcriptional regulator